jgi:hypothetical protein
MHQTEDLAHRETKAFLQSLTWSIDRMNPEMKAKLEAAITALVSLVISACSGTAAAVTTFPKTFSEFFKSWQAANPENKGFVYEVFKRSSGTTWTPGKVKLVVLGDAEFNASLKQDVTMDAIKDALLASIGFSGELEIEIKGDVSGKTEKVTKGKEKAEKKEPAPDLKEVQKMCSEVAKKHGREAVVELLKEFGAEKVAELKEEVLADVVKALKNYDETSSNGF